MTAPSRATVNGCPAAMASTKSSPREQASAAVVRVAIRSRNSPGSDPIHQLRTRSKKPVIGRPPSYVAQPHGYPKCVPGAKLGFDVVELPMRTKLADGRDLLFFGLPGHRPA